MIDGFNLYYGALKGKPLKWLDLEAWCAALVPDCDVTRIVYCTARVANKAHDVGANERQDKYLQALSSLRSVEVLLGNFSVKSTRMPRLSNARCGCCQGHWTPCHCCGHVTVEVEKTEEKGSDVNLAVQLVADGFQDEYDLALVVSDDSDLQPAVDVVRHVLGKRVIVADPRNRKHPALIGDERRRIRPGVLASCQLPEVVALPNGRSVRRPPAWG